MRLSELVSGIADEVGGSGDPEIVHFTIDVEEVRPGTLFAARRNWYGDTHTRLEEAIARGAAAVVVSTLPGTPLSVPVVLTRNEDPALGHLSRRFYGAPTAGLKVFGVTGTNGKTTVTWMLTHILRRLGMRPALMGTLGYRYGDRTIPASNTTPDALVIHRFAADAAARGADALVLEVSSHALAIGRVAGVCFDSVGFTNLSHDHLDFHGDESAYFAAKRRLLTDVQTASRAFGKRPRGVVCVDDPAGCRLLTEVGDAIAVATQTSPVDASWTVAEIGRGGLTGMDAALHTPEGRYRVKLPLVGAFNLANAGVAAAMAAVVHPDAQAEIWAALTDFPGVPGRMEQVVPGVFVDYAHTPAAVARAAATLRQRTDLPLTIVVGCGGARDRAKRPRMAQRAAEAADALIVTSDNPRDEAPGTILDEMVGGLSGPFVRQEDRARAIWDAVSREGVRLIAGKGHERYQEIAGRRFHFDDREEVRRAGRAIAEGVSPGEAPLWWGWAAVDADPAALAGKAVVEAKARPGGLLVVKADDIVRVGAQAEGRFPPAAVLAAPYPGCGHLLTAGHRVLVTSGAVPEGLVDVQLGGDGTDWPGGLSVAERRALPAAEAPQIPTLGRGE